MGNLAKLGGKSPKLAYKSDMRQDSFNSTKKGHKQAHKKV